MNRVFGTKLFGDSILRGVDDTTAGTWVMVQVLVREVRCKGTWRFADKIQVTAFGTVFALMMMFMSGLGIGNRFA